MNRGGSVWWLWPIAPLIGLTATSLMVAGRLDDEMYRRAWRTPKQLDGPTVLLMLAVVVALVAGTMVVALLERDRRARLRSSWPALPGPTVDVLRRLYPWLIGLSLFGYAVWIGVGLLRGLSVADVRTVFTTQDNFLLPIKERLETLPGLTTLTQVAIPASIVGVLLDIQRPSTRVRRAYRLLILLALLRAFVLAERLAIAELVVPIMVLRATALAHRLAGTRRVLLTLAPVFGVVLLVSGFAVSEYSRSWNWYSSRTEVGLVGFAAERLAGYYATSHNNGALMLHHGQTVTDIPYHTTLFVWQVPPGSQLAGGLNDDVEDDKRRVLKSYGNEEFNSPSGLASILIDFGTVGGIVFAFMFGMILGSLHLSFLHGRILGLLLYPMAYTGLLELPRYLYWFQGRAIPTIAVGLLVTVLLARIFRTRAAPVPATGAGPAMELVPR